MRRTLHWSGILSAVLVLSHASIAAAGGHDDHGRDRNWFTAWAQSSGARMGPAFTGPNFAPDISNTTIRMIVRPSISGDQIRVRLENTQATTPVTFTGAYIGVLGTGAALVPGTNERMTFNHGKGVTLAAGASAWSDPVRFDVHAFQRLVVSLDVQSAVEITGHQLGLVTNYIGTYGTARSSSGAGFTPVPQNAGGYPFYYVAAVDVHSDTASGTVVLLGDSITDGRCSTRDPVTGDIPADIYNRWGDTLAARLHARYGRRAPAVAIEAIAGNRVVLPGGNGPAAVLRLDNDVLDRAGLSAVIFFEGTNDITGSATTAQLIAGAQEVIDRVHAKGVPIYVATVMPRGRPAPLTGWQASFEQVKTEFDHWLHTDANVDGLVEFGALFEGPLVIENDGLPAMAMWPEWACFDYTHSNKYGYPHMGGLIDLDLFKPHHD